MLISQELTVYSEETGRLRKPTASSPCTSTSMKKGSIAWWQETKHGKF